MNTLNLNQYVDSSQDMDYLRWRLVWAEGMRRIESPFNSSTVNLRSADLYLLNPESKEVVSYPLYSRGKGVN